MTSDAVLRVERFPARRLLVSIDTVPHRPVLCAGDEDQQDCKQDSQSRHRVMASLGKLNAMYSPEYGPPLTATTMYCLPLSM